MRIVVSQNIDNLGPGESQPVFYHWHWYQNVPTLPIWALIILLLVVPKANRNRQAWLILIPLGLVLIIWRMPATLLSAPPWLTESLGGFIVSGTLAWSVVWLMGNRLTTKNRKRSFFLIFAVMLVIGLLSYLCHFDNLNYIVIMAIAYCIYVSIIPMAMMLTSYFCRNKYSPKRFRGWLLVWIIAVTLGLMLSYIALIMAIVRPGWQVLLVFLTSAFISPFIIGVILYLINLPFLELALRCPLYQDRLEKIFHVYKERRLEEELDQPSSDMPPSP